MTPIQMELKVRKMQNKVCQNRRCCIKISSKYINIY